MSIVFDRAVPFYDQTRGLPAQAEIDLARVLREATDLHPGSAVLEIGVGTGRIALPLVRHNGYRYTGIDLSSEMMRQLQRKAQADQIALVRGNIAQLPFRDEQFDGVVAVHIFHLIDRWAAAMDEARRVLKRGGMLLNGYNHHVNKERSAETALRNKLDELAGQGQAPTGRLAWNEIRQHLIERFGEPHTIETPSWQTTKTPRAIIDQFRQRIWSFTWQIPDEEIDTVAQQATAWAIAELGGLDVTITNEQTFRWELFTKRP